MGLIFYLVKIAAGATVKLIGSAVIKACLPRMPPSNWNTSSTAIFPIRTALPARCKRKFKFKRRSLLSNQEMPDFRFDEDDYVGSRRFFQDVEESSPAVHFESEGSEQGNTTLCSMDDCPMVDFSIYSDASSPDLNKAMFITPAPPSLFDAKDVDYNLLLVEASERVSEILRENRRRLDAGEDPCTYRREARRKRAQELSTIRKPRLYLF